MTHFGQKSLDFCFIYLSLSTRIFNDNEYSPNVSSFPPSETVLLHFIRFLLQAKYSCVYSFLIGRTLENTKTERIIWTGSM